MFRYVADHNIRNHCSFGQTVSAGDRAVERPHLKLMRQAGKTMWDTLTPPTTISSMYYSQPTVDIPNAFTVLVKAKSDDKDLKCKNGGGHKQK